MSDNLSLKAARALYSDVLSYERGGCTAECLSREVWFLNNNCGSDRRFPSNVIANYIRRVSGYSEEELAEGDVTDDGEDDVFPVLTSEHPMTVDWSGNVRRTDLAWATVCPKLYPDATSDITDYSIVTDYSVDPIREDLR